MLIRPLYRLVHLLKSLGACFKMGGTGDPPVTVGDSPTGTETRAQGEQAVFVACGRARRVAGRYRPVACATQSSIFRLASGAWVALLVLLGLASGASAAPVTELKILSFNIWVNGGSSLSNCIEVIRTAGADIVGLQECNAPTAQIIASNLGFHVTADNGASIVSRFRILTNIAAGGGRGVTIEPAPGQRVHFFNCHLTAYPYGPYDLRDGKSASLVIDQENSTRMPALKQLLAAMAPYLASAEPCFLTGDFNAPSHFDYAAFPWPTSIACTNAGLIDSYLVAHPRNRKFPGPFAFNDPGITWTPMTNEEPKGVFDRIDFVYFSAGDGVEVKRATELDGRNSVAAWPSDHRAVLSIFTLGPRR